MQASAHPAGPPRPASGSARPASGSARPASGSARPASGSARPASGSARPASGSGSAAGSARPATGRGRQEAPRSRGRILLVEDDPEAALFAVYALENRGRFEVVHTPDPAVALALAATEQWDLALTDLDLPVMPGTELITALRRIAPHLPVILVTGDVQDAFAAAGRCRPDDVLVKPVSADRLLAAAVALAGRRDPDSDPDPDSRDPAGCR